MINVTVPDGECGDWKVETFTVGEPTARMFCRPSEYVPPGTYKRLTRGHVVVMSNTPMEEHTNRPIIRHAKGDVMINGLGLGMVLTAILAKEDVRSITVIEKSSEVIQLVGPSFADERVTIVHDDALTHKPEKNARYDAVWHDIWDFICADNLEDMKLLHRRYGRRADWQGSWARGECELYDRRWKAAGRFR